MQEARPRRDLLLLCLALLSICCLSAAAQDKKERAINPQHPLQVDLLAPLDVSKLKPDDRIFAKSRIEWRSETCSMRVGATVSGRVLEAERRTKDSNASKLIVLFDTASCNGISTPLLFDLFAIIVDPKIHNGIGLADYGTFGAASNQPHIGLGGAPPQVAIPMDRSQDMAIQNSDSRLKLPAVIEAGQVFGQKNLFLASGTGPGGGSILSSPKGNLRVEAGAQLVLMPRPVLTARTAPATLTPPTSSEKKEPEQPRVAEKKDAPVPVEVQPETPDEMDVCSSQCSVISSATGTPLTQASYTLSASGLGYGPRENARYSGLTQQATLSFLDANNLLFTFDSKLLHRRYVNGGRTETIRTVRAVLMDASSGTVKRIRDWQVQGNSRYLWPTTRGRVFVHLGHTLYLMNSQLEPIRSVHVPGELVFVSLSPSGDRIAVGLLHERHTPDLHEQLADVLHGEPEEDVDVLLLDDDFTLLRTSYQSTSLPAPTLTEAGEIHFRAIGHNQWRISEHRWNQTETPITTIRSQCRPELSTPLPGSLFVVGCNQSPLQNWYRVLRSDGHPILVDRGSSREIQQAAQGAMDNEIAVRVVHSADSRANGDFFFKSDLHTQEISIYRVSDGRRTFETTATVSLADQSFALSPSGNNLAILAGDKINFYTLPVGQ